MLPRTGATHERVGRSLRRSRNAVRASSPSVIGAAVTSDASVLGFTFDFVGSEVVSRSMANNSRKRPRPRTRAAANISPGRAQDWISSVLNPLVDGLKLEARYLPGGPWFWKRSGNQFVGFEHFFRCRQHVHKLYEDNFDDFVAKHPQLEKPMQVHDLELQDLAKSIDEAYRRIVVDASYVNEGTQELGKLVGESGDVRETLHDVAMFVAGGVKELGSRYSIASVYNSATRARELAEFAATEPRRERDKTSATLSTTVDALQRRLVDERSRIADTYGARIRPVESSFELHDEE